MVFCIKNLFGFFRTTSKHVCIIYPPKPFLKAAAVISLLYEALGLNVLATYSTNSITSFIETFLPV